MNSCQKYYEKSLLKEGATEEVSKSVQNTLDLISLLFPLEIVKLKKVLRNVSVF